MKNVFNSIQKTKVGSNTFDLSHQRKFSMKIGELTPILVQECVPGDKWTISGAHMSRMAPMISPIMHQITGYTHYFFVPNRIIWDNWEDFITGGEDGLKDPAMPYLTFESGELTEGSLADYLGLPHTPDGSLPLGVNALPFYAYQKVYNDYFKDQNLVNEVIYDKSQGDGNQNAYKNLVNKIVLN